MSEVSLKAIYHQQKLPVTETTATSEIGVIYARDFEPLKRRALNARAYEGPLRGGEGLAFFFFFFITLKPRVE